MFGDDLIAFNGTIISIKPNMLRIPYHYVQCKTFYIMLIVGFGISGKNQMKKQLENNAPLRPV